MCPGSITRYYPSGLQKLVVAHSAYLSGIHFYLPSLQELGNNWISTLLGHGCDAMSTLGLLSVSFSCSLRFRMI